jgi:hypothetical protein
MALGVVWQNRRMSALHDDIVLLPIPIFGVDGLLAVVKAGWANAADIPNTKAAPASKYFMRYLRY